METWGDNYSDAHNDDLSLVTNNAGEYRHLAGIDAWLNALGSIQTDPREAQPNMDVFANALDTASDPSTQDGSGRVVILITPPPDQAGINAVQNLTSLAIQQNTRIVVWMISSADLLDTPAANQLRELALQTDGEFFAFSGTEPFPDLEESIDQLRRSYRVTYQSRLQAGTEHVLSAAIDMGDITVEAEQQSFNLEVLPPNPVLVSPPIEIILQAEVIPNETPDGSSLRYSPEEQVFEILIEFPDGQPRELVSTTLFVNGQAVDQNTEEPFDRFTWDLTDFQFESEHMVQVEVTDILGISNRSVQTPVQVSIKRTPRSFLAVVYTYRWWVIGSTTVLATGIILVILISGGKIQPRSKPRRKTSRAKTVVSPKKSQRKDPVTQPVNIQQPKPPARLPNWVRRFSWSRRLPSEPAPAYIEPFQTNTTYGDLKTIDLAADEIIIGSSTEKSSVIIDSPGVEPEHARIISEPEENFRIFDLSSTSGTLLNFAPLSPSGARLRHGDIIHFGAIPYRVMFRDPSRIPKPVVQPLEREY